MKKKNGFLTFTLFAFMTISLLCFGGMEVLASTPTKACHTCELTNSCPEAPLAADDGTPQGCSYWCGGTCTQCSGSGTSGYCVYTGVLTDSCDYSTSSPITCGNTATTRCYKDENTHKCGCSSTTTYSTNGCSLNQCL